MLSPSPSCRRLFLHTMFLAWNLAPERTGSRMVARIEMIAITTSSSIKVNACRVKLIRLQVSTASLRSSAFLASEAVTPLVRTTTPSTILTFRVNAAHQNGVEIPTRFITHLQLIKSYHYGKVENPSNLLHINPLKYLLCSSLAQFGSTMAMPSGPKRAGFDFAYTFPGMNRVLQAVGCVNRNSGVARAFSRAFHLESIHTYSPLSTRVAWWLSPQNAFVRLFRRL